MHPHKTRYMLIGALLVAALVCLAASYDTLRVSWAYTAERIANIAVSNVTPTNGQYMVYDATQGHWEPRTSAPGAGDMTTAVYDPDTDGVIALGEGGTGAVNAAGARTNLGLVINTNVQGWDAQLDEWATIDPSANGGSLVSAANYAAMRTLLSLVPGTDVQEYSGNLTLWAGSTPTTFTIDAGNVTSGTLGTDRYSAFADLTAEGRIGTAAGNVSAGDHNHAGVYQGADAGLAELAGIAVETAANGTLLIGDGTGMTLATLTAGSNVSITVGAGSISIAGNTTAAAINAQGLDDELTDIAGLSPTLGYLIVGNSTAFITLAPGANGTVLSADSAEATGVEWAPARAPLAAVRHVFWPAGAAIPYTTGGAATGTVSTANVTYDTYDFDSGATEEAVSYVGYLEHWNLSAVSVKFAWTAASGTGNVSWSVAGLSYADGDALDTAPGTANTTLDTLTTAGDVHISPATTITVGGTPGAGEPLIFQIIRDTSGDDLNADARLLGIWIQYTESTTEEAAW